MSQAGQDNASNAAVASASVLNTQCSSRSCIPSQSLIAIFAGHDAVRRAALAKHLPQVAHELLWDLKRGKVPALVVIFGFVDNVPERARPSKSCGSASEFH